MFDTWGELIEASIVTKHIILYMKVVQTDFLSVKGEIKKKKEKVEEEEGEEKKTHF